MKYLDDIFLFCGLAAITTSAFMFNMIIGVFVLGSALIASAIIIAKGKR